MSAVTVYTRGQSVTVAAQFFDEDGGPATPEYPVLHYSYVVAGAAVGDEVEMTMNSDGEWQGVIDTSPADDGIVYWTIRAAGVAKEGNFRLVANPANPVQSA